MLRRIVEYAARGKVFKRKLPPKFGKTPLYVTPDSQLKYLSLWGDVFDNQLLKIAQTRIKENSIVWDIGANVGVFSFAAANIAKHGEVLAVEPDQWLISLIRRSMQLPQNRQLNLKSLSVAISDKNGVKNFYISKRGRALNQLETVRGLEKKEARETMLVPTLTLDTLLENFRPPTFIKIDVESAELPVLQGARKILTEIKPVLYIEVSENTKSAVTTLLCNHGYSLFSGKNMCQISVCEFNTLAISSEKI